MHPNEGYRSVHHVSQHTPCSSTHTLNKHYESQHPLCISTNTMHLNLRAHYSIENTLHATETRHTFNYSTETRHNRDIPHIIQQRHATHYSTETPHIQLFNRDTPQQRHATHNSRDTPHTIHTIQQRHTQ